MLTAILVCFLSAPPPPPPPALPQPLPPPVFSTFPKVPGWTVGELASYDEKSLYEYIDGAAGAFLQADFRSLRSATYTDAAKVEVTVDVYQHRDALSAFAIYAQERPSTYTPLPVGTEGYAGEDHLEFVAGPYYAKLTQSKGGATALRGIAEKVALALPGPRGLPAVLGCFPEKGKLARRERVALREFFGHAFLRRGYSAPYVVEGAKFRLFAIEGDDAADAQAMLRQYFALAKRPVVGGAGAGAEGHGTLVDPIQGAVSLAWKGRWLWGAVDGAAPQALVDELGRCLGALRR
jgi:hypothetical protein